MSVQEWDYTGWSGGMEARPMQNGHQTGRDSTAATKLRKKKRSDRAERIGRKGDEQSSKKQ